MKTLVAGIGNIFFGDDGFGVEVAGRLLNETLPAGVKVVDYGIRSVHLAYELLDGYDALILIDALPHGGAPGSVVVMEPALADGDAEGGRDGDQDGAEVRPALDAHTMNPVAVLDMLAGLGGSVEHVFVVGCEPRDLHEGIGLSSEVAAAVDHAVTATWDLVEELSAERTSEREAV